MKFCCASNAAIKNVQIARKQLLFQQYRNFFQKITKLKGKPIFSDSRGSSRHFDYLLSYE